MPRKLTRSPMQFNRCSTEVTVTLRKDLRGYFTSEFKTDEIEQISNSTRRIWIVILNRSLTEEIVFKKDKLLVFFIVESKDKINIKYKTTGTKKKVTPKISIKKKKKKRQRGGFLNR